MDDHNSDNGDVVLHVTMPQHDESHTHDDDGDDDDDVHGKAFHKVHIPPPKKASDIAFELKHKLQSQAQAFHPAGFFQGPNACHRFLLIMQTIFPIIEWAPKYRLSYLRADFVAGLTIASLAIPQGISYAKLAGLPPILGLYSSFVPPIIYALMGSSRDLAVGTVSTVSIMLRSLLADEESDPVLHLQLAITATFFAGVFQACLGLFRLGFILDLLSHATLVGFMCGAAITISLQQIKGLLGIQNFTMKTDLISVIRSALDARDEWNWHPAVIGVCFLIWLLITRQISKRKKELFWVSAIAPLVSVIVSTLCVYLTRADTKGVTIVGDLKRGLNPGSTGMIFLQGQYALKGIKIGMITGLVALTEAIAVGRTFAALNDYRIDGNKEMTAIGLMNLAGCCTSCYVTTGSLTRSAIRHNAGGKTAASNIFMALVLMVTLLFLTPLFRYIPNAVLSSVIIAAVINLIDIPAMIAIWKVDKVDFLVVMGALVGVLFMSVYMGLVIAIVISMLKLLLPLIRPHISTLGNIPGTSIYSKIEQYPDAEQVFGLSILQIDTSIYFSNANYVEERITNLFSPPKDKTQDVIKEQMHSVILEMSAVTNIDTTGVYMLQNLHMSMKKRNVQLALANPSKKVIMKLESVGFLQHLGHEWLFIDVGEAVSNCSLVRRMKNPKNVDEAVP